jgi:hypothetical protein
VPESVPRVPPRPGFVGVFVGCSNPVAPTISSRAKRLSRFFVALRACAPSRAPCVLSRDSAGLLAPSRYHL